MNQEACDVPERVARCDHICLLPADHLDRGVLHQYGYELPSPRPASVGYEYRIVSCDGVGYPSPTRSEHRCVARAEGLDASRPERAPHRVERRLIGAWEVNPRGNFGGAL